MLWDPWALRKIPGSPPENLRVPSDKELTEVTVTRGSRFGAGFPPEVEEFDPKVNPDALGMN